MSSLSVCLFLFGIIQLYIICMNVFKKQSQTLPALEEKGERRGSGERNKTPAKTEPSSFYSGRVLMSIFIYSDAEALQPILNTSLLIRKGAHSYLPWNPTHPCRQA